MARSGPGPEYPVCCQCRAAAGVPGPAPRRGGGPGLRPAAVPGSTRIRCVGLWLAGRPCADSEQTRSFLRHAGDSLARETRGPGLGFDSCCCLRRDHDPSHTSQPRSRLPTRRARVTDSDTGRTRTALGRGGSRVVTVTGECRTVAGSLSLSPWQSQCMTRKCPGRAPAQSVIS